VSDEKKESERGRILKALARIPPLHVQRLGLTRRKYKRIVSTPLEDQVSRVCQCAACERDGQHAPWCAVHEEPTFGAR
jgi:hypothetical protein